MRRALATLLDALSVVLVAGYAKFATAAPPAEFDFLTDWGLKARVFFLARGIDWNFLEHAPPHLVHQNYPPLVPLTFDLVAALRGGWNDEWLGIVNVAFAVALLLFVRWLAFRETSSHLVAAFVTVALVPLACVPWIGTADGPFIVFATATLLLIRRRSLTAGAILLGLAAMTKNEGLTLCAAVVISLVIDRRPRDVVRLWPALLVTLPWFLVRAFHRLPNEVLNAGAAGRVAENLRHLGSLFVVFTRDAFTAKPLFWVALAIGLVIIARCERFLLTAVALQLAAYGAGILALPWNPYAIRFGAERLVAHVAPSLAYVVLVTLSASGLRLMSRNSSAMPMQIAESATLNAGQ